MIRNFGANILADTLTRILDAYLVQRGCATPSYQNNKRVLSRTYRARDRMAFKDAKVRQYHTGAYDLFKFPRERGEVGLELKPGFRNALVKTRFKNVRPICRPLRGISVHRIEKREKSKVERRKRKTKNNDVPMV